MAGVQLTGLASGFDWKSFIDQMMEIERAPITRLQSTQTTNSRKSTSLSTLDTKVTALQTAVTALKTSGNYNQRTVTSDTTGSSWKFSASEGAAVGSYTFDVQKLASASTMRGSSGIVSTLNPSTTLSALPIATAVTAGTFTVNGKQFEIKATGSAPEISLDQSFQSLIDAINDPVTGAPGVTASFNAGTGKLELNSATAITVGAANDTSNFLAAMRLTNNGTSQVASAANLTTPPLYSTLSSVGFATTPSATGTFNVNGVAINYDTSVDTLSALISRINDSSAGVTASFDASEGRMVLTNDKTGSLGISVAEVTGNMAQALGLLGASTTLGDNATVVVTGGGRTTTIESQTNVLEASSHGITGLSVTLDSKSKQTLSVAADTSSAKTKINDFIAKYNDVQDYIESQTKITNTKGKVTTSTLTDNREVQEWSRSLRSMAFSAITGATGTIDQLADLGIDVETSTSAKLSIKDSTKLDAALNSNAADVSAFFSTATTGFAAKFDTFFTSVLGAYGTKGSLDTQVQNLADRNSAIDTQIADIERRLEQQKASLTSNFVRMEEMQQKTNTVLSQLTKSFGSSS